MPLRVGVLSSAHVHTGGYVHALLSNPAAECVGLWDNDGERGADYCKRSDLTFFEDRAALFAAVDAVVICSENNFHGEFAEAAALAGKHILCEKPLATSEVDYERMMTAVKSSGVKVMTAFPCRFSPAWQMVKDRIAAGEIGKLKAICATNRGRCPFGWFVKPEVSGGGAMIDHVVHVTDLLRDLLQEEPLQVQAQIGSNMYGKEWDDTAMVTIEFPSGVFASLDSSWSRPQQFKTWGDVTMNLVGEKGVIELDMFGSGLDHYHPGSTTHSFPGYGANLDYSMVDAFVQACLNDTEVPITAHDGMQAARVALAGYQSAKSGTPIAV